MIFFLVLLVALALFFIPTFVAFARRHPNRWLILVINMVFGGTGLGWFGSLIWACHAVHRSDGGSVGGASGLNLFIDDVQQIAIADQAVLPLEELRRLKVLLDQGAINPYEYRLLKERLLGPSTTMRQLPR